MFIDCEKCGKKLIERGSNGIWYFKFGKQGNNRFIVNMEIHGSLRITCLRRSCQHVNVLNYFPPDFLIIPSRGVNVNENEINDNQGD